MSNLSNEINTWVSTTFTGLSVSAEELSSVVINGLGELRDMFFTDMTPGQFREKSSGMGSQEECKEARDVVKSESVNPQYTRPSHPRDKPLRKYAKDVGHDDAGYTSIPEGLRVPLLKDDRGDKDIKGHEDETLDSLERVNENTLEYTSTTSNYIPFKDKNLTFRGGETVEIKDGYATTINGIPFKISQYRDCGRCWLCGITVYAFKGDSDDGEELKTSCGECEHVSAYVPTLLAGMLAVPRESGDRWGHPGFQYSYQPSCVECNQYKKKFVGIKIIKSGWTTDVDAIDLLMKRMWGEPGRRKNNHRKEGNPFRWQLNDAVAVSGNEIWISLNRKQMVGNGDWFESRKKKIKLVLDDWCIAANRAAVQHSIIKTGLNKPQLKKLARNPFTSPPVTPNSMVKWFIASTECAFREVNQSLSGGRRNSFFLKNKFF